MNKVRLVLNIILTITLLNLIALLSYDVYQNYFSPSKYFGVEYYESSEGEMVNISSEARQFQPNMRFNHNNISYFMEESCGSEKKERVERAFEIISEKVGKLSFHSAKNTIGIDILVICSQEKYEEKDENGEGKGWERVFIAGEGGPTKYLNLSFYPLILEGKILLYNESTCKEPITELHEIFHVFGFEHINNPNKIMYPYVSCKQEIDSEIVNILAWLYSIPSLSEIYFSNVTASKSGIFLDFNATVNNEGLINAENVSLDIYAYTDKNSAEKIDSFGLGDIEMGGGKIFYATNIRLPSREVKRVRLEIAVKSPNQEYTTKNNVVELEIRE